MMCLLSKKQICMEGGYMLDNIILFIIWLIVGVMSAFIATVIYFIGDGFVTRFKEIYKEAYKMALEKEKNRRNK